MKWINPNNREPEGDQIILIKIPGVNGFPYRIVTGQYCYHMYWIDPKPNEGAQHSVDTKDILGWAPIEALDELEQEGQADEMKASFYDRELNKYDRVLFVKNLGDLLSQTCTGVTGCSLDADKDIVTITYQNGYQKKVSVECDSYAAIILDVTKAVA